MSEFLDELKVQIGRLAPLEAIVRSLAESHPVWFEDLVGCKHCSNEFNDLVHAQKPAAHASWCIWRLAVEWTEGVGP